MRENDHELENTAIPTETPSHDFLLCWQAAIRHLDLMGEKAAKTIRPELLMPIPGCDACVWLKSEPRPPFLEHLSFRFGNQLFFVRLEDTENKLDAPGTRAGLQRIADACKGHACLMPMRKRGNQWIPASSGWGLISVPYLKLLPPPPGSDSHGYFYADSHGYGMHLSERGGKPIDPPSLVTYEKIESTDWELQDLAVQVVRNSIPYEKLMSWHSDPDVDPSLWFVGEHGPEWVVVRAVRYPIKDTELPHNMAQIARGCSRLSQRGNFAVVSIAADEPSKLQGKAPPLYRGHAADVTYDGMKTFKI